MPGATHEETHARVNRVVGHPPAYPANGYAGAYQRTIGEEYVPTFWRILVEQGVTAYLCSHILAFDVQCHDGVLQITSAGAGTAPKIGLARDAQLQHRSRVLSMTCPSGLSGLPQVTLPLAQVGGCPLGLSFVGPHGSDRALLDFAAAFANQQTGGEER